MADEEGILHRIADPPEKKPSSKIFEKAGTEQEKLNLQHPGRRLPPASQEQRIRLPENPVVHLIHEKMDTNYKEKKKQTR